MYVCMYVCMHILCYVCMYVCMHVYNDHNYYRSLAPFKICTIFVLIVVLEPLWLEFEQNISLHMDVQGFNCFCRDMM